jgi:TrmH family RNA methyltransferase
MESDLIISSNSNPTIKLARSLRQRKVRDESGLFLVEGIHNVGSAVEAGWDISSILYSQDLLRSTYANQLIDDQRLKGRKCQPILAQVFNSVAEKENPQGILAIVHQCKIELGQLSPDTYKWGIAVISPQDPGNVGTIIRTIDCVGADGLFLLDGGVDAYHPSCVRASMGALFWKPTIRASFSNFIDWAQANGYNLIGTSTHAEKDYRTLALEERPSILILGNEQRGMTKDQMDACDVMISLPMHGQASSLNLSVAAGIFLYAMLK